MANPNDDNGHVRVPNELYEAIIRQNFSGNELRTCLAIYRLLKGWHKAKDWIANSQVAKGTGLTINQATKMVKRLERRNILNLSYEDKGTKRIVEFNKDYDTWQTMPKKARFKTHAQKGIPPMLKKATTKDIVTKDINILARHRAIDIWRKHTKEKGGVLPNLPKPIPERFYASFGARYKEGVVTADNVETIINNYHEVLSNPQIYYYDHVYTFMRFWQPGHDLTQWYDENEPLKNFRDKTKTSTPKFSGEVNPSGKDFFTAGGK